MEYSISAGVLQVRHDREHMTDTMLVPVGEIRRIAIKKSLLARVLGGLCVLSGLLATFFALDSQFYKPGGLLGALVLFVVAGWMDWMSANIFRKVTIQTATRTFRVAGPPREVARMEEEIRQAMAEPRGIVEQAAPAT